MQTTPNFGLTIYEPNDVTAYLTSEGWNGTMEKIDTAMKQLEDTGTKNTADLNTLEQQVSSDHDEINKITGELSDLTQTVQGNTNNISGLNNRVLAAETDIATLQSSMEDAVAQRYDGVLSANEDTIAIEIGDFTDDSLVVPFTNIWGVTPLTVELRTATGGQPNLCVMTFKAQATDMKVAVQIYNKR